MAGSKLSLSQAKAKGPKKEKPREQDEKQKSMLSFFSRSQSPNLVPAPKDPPSRVPSTDSVDSVGLTRAAASTDAGNARPCEKVSPVFASKGGKGPALPPLLLPKPEVAISWAKARPPLSSSTIDSSGGLSEPAASAHPPSSAARPEQGKHRADARAAASEPPAAPLLCGSKRARELLQSSSALGAGVAGSPHARASTASDGLPWDDSPAARPPPSAGKALVTPATVPRAEAGRMRHASFGMDDDDADVTPSQVPPPTGPRRAALPRPGARGLEVTGAPSLGNVIGGGKVQ